MYGPVNSMFRKVGDLKACLKMSTLITPALPISSSSSGLALTAEDGTPRISHSVSTYSGGITPLKSGIK